MPNPNAIKKFANKTKMFRVGMRRNGRLHQIDSSSSRRRKRLKLKVIKVTYGKHVFWQSEQFISYFFRSAFCPSFASLCSQNCQFEFGKIFEERRSALFARAFSSRMENNGVAGAAETSLNYFVRRAPSMRKMRSIEGVRSSAERTRRTRNIIGKRCRFIGSLETAISLRLLLLSLSSPQFSHLIF